ncbi:MAG: hypothetical protein KTR25_03050 [Myxococcales bacterium]|nr:hypothetical protein [Myxococcales bacterium]
MTIVALSGLLPIIQTAYAQEETNDAHGPTNVDLINLAKRMLQDQHYDRALASLQQVDLAEEGVAEMEFWRLIGISYYKLSQWDDAQKAYAKAIELGDLQPGIYLQRANAFIEMKRPKEALEVIQNVPPSAAILPNRFIIESTAHYENGDKSQAYLVMDQGYKTLPDNEIIARKRILLLVDLGLHQTAITEAQTFFERGESTSEDYAALATALIKAKQPERAALLLEQAALIYPLDLDLRNRLALAYFEKEQPLSAGDILYPVALVDPESARSAAELYIKAKHFIRAYRMNSRIDDQPQKVRQRLIILLEKQHFEAATSLYTRIERLDLLKDESLVYALAYAFYRTGNFQRMEYLLSLITDSSLFEKSVELRKFAEECRQSFWKCS